MPGRSHIIGPTALDVISPVPDGYSRVSGDVLDRLIREDEIAPEALSALVNVYPAYAVGAAYAIGALVAKGGELYEVIQAHTSQADWVPASTPALYLRRTPAGVIPEWVQPTGSHDAYALGDQVTFAGQVWESLIAANVWSPTAYPAGWKLIA